MRASRLSVLRGWRRAGEGRRAISGLLLRRPAPDAELAGDSCLRQPGVGEPPDPEAQLSVARRAADALALGAPDPSPPFLGPRGGSARWPTDSRRPGFTAHAGTGANPNSGAIFSLCSRAARSPSPVNL